jgi:hypothetical protein
MRNCDPGMQTEIFLLPLYRGSASLAPMTKAWLSGQQFSAGASLNNLEGGGTNGDKTTGDVNRDPPMYCDPSCLPVTASKQYRFPSWQPKNTNSIEMPLSSSTGKVQIVGAPLTSPGNKARQA